MLKLIEEDVGKSKGVPILILAGGASIDDVVAITIFSVFLGLYSGDNINIGMQLLEIPISILLGIALGLFAGLVLIRIFTKYHMRDTKKSFTIIRSRYIINGNRSLFRTKDKYSIINRSYDYRIYYS